MLRIQGGGRLAGVGGQHRQTEAAERREESLLPPTADGKTDVVVDR